MQNKKVVLLSIIAILALFIGGTYFYKSSKAKEYQALVQKKKDSLQRPYSLVVGNSDANVQLVEFFDPACGTCAQFHPYVKNIMKENEGKIKLVLRYAPFHKNSDFAVRVLEASRKQDKFMQTLEILFATQGYWTENHVVIPEKIWRVLPKAGLDMQMLANDMKNDEITKIIKQDLFDAQELGANKTPSYFVNGKPLEVFGLQELIDLINSQL
ncbi:thioredoxin domain-containing protein [Malaciobacter mytili]|uniref:DsbA family protein n=1 Tax=Malaciobacter mytili TaxID=603050 RepID=UPI003A8855DB